MCARSAAPTGASLAARRMSAARRRPSLLPEKRIESPPPRTTKSRRHEPRQRHIPPHRRDPQRAHLGGRHARSSRSYAADCPGRAEIFPEFADGLADIEGFSHLYLLYWLHRADPPQLRVKPYLQDVEHGIFATRAPCRPNPIGLSLVRLRPPRRHVCTSPASTCSTARRCWTSSPTRPAMTPSRTRAAAGRSRSTKQRPDGAAGGATAARKMVPPLDTVSHDQPHYLGRKHRPRRRHPRRTRALVLDRHRRPSRAVRHRPGHGADPTTPRGSASTWRRPMRSSSATAISTTSAGWRPRWRAAPARAAVSASTGGRAQIHRNRSGRGAPDQHSVHGDGVIPAR